MRFHLSFNKRLECFRPHQMVYIASENTDNRTQWIGRATPLDLCKVLFAKNNFVTHGEKKLLI